MRGATLVHKQKFMPSSVNAALRDFLLVSKVILTSVQDIPIQNVSPTRFSLRYDPILFLVFGFVSFYHS